MSAEKKVPERVEGVPARAGRATRARRRVPSAHVLATFDNMLDDFRRGFRESFWEPWELPAIEPYVGHFMIREAYSDLVDAGDKYLVRVEVPGIPKDKIDVTVTKDGIEISAETGAMKEEKERNFIIRERNHSSICKSLEFPEEVVPEKAESTLKDGILEVSIPKKTPTPEPKKHKVEVKEAKQDLPQGGA